MKTGIAALAGLTLAASSAFGQCSAGATAAKGHCSSDTVTMGVMAAGNIVETAKSAGTFNTLLAAATAAGLVETLSGDKPLTVFAPTDEAFAKLGDATIQTLLKPENKDRLKAILLYHVVPGNVPAAEVVKLSGVTTVNGQRADLVVNNGAVRIDQANVIKTDITASNGTIHVIDRVILPVEENIVQVADKAGSFGTLIAAAKAAGLAETLMGPGPLTVLAPTDEAFQALGADTIATLLKPESKDKLAEILKYHVIPGRVFSAQAVEAASAKTVQGGSVDFISKYGKVQVNGANVVTADIDASNGVIHVIDRVLLPKSN